jgi:hypothetical protein
MTIVKSVCVRCNARAYLTCKRCGETICNECAWTFAGATYCKGCQEWEELNFWGKPTRSPLQPVKCPGRDCGECMIEMCDRIIGDTE